MDDLISITKALADKGRMRVIAALLAYDELCVCQIVEMLGLATATVSRHMSILQSARLVQSRKEGKWVYYRCAECFPGALRSWLIESLDDSQTFKADQSILKKILAGDRDKLCRTQKKARLTKKED
ncbi:MAG: metalloregulator ArsR/SmtB family transcription factor [Pseudomonadota bacterium]